jgi:hypothetical protein
MSSAEMELHKLQRQYRIMEGDRKAYSEESRLLISRQKSSVDKLRKDNEYLQDELKLLHQQIDDSQRNGPGSKKAEELLERAGKGLVCIPGSRRWGSEHASFAVCCLLLNSPWFSVEEYQKRIRDTLQAAQIFDKKVAEVEERIKLQRQDMGGSFAGSTNTSVVEKQIKGLENRLDKALVKFNKALEANKQLRTKIDRLRRERLVFDNLRKKFERDMTEQKKQMAEIIEASNNAYEAR